MSISEISSGKLTVNKKHINCENLTDFRETVETGWIRAWFHMVAKDLPCTQALRKGSWGGLKREAKKLSRPLCLCTPTAENLDLSVIACEATWYKAG